MVDVGSWFLYFVLWIIWYYCCGCFDDEVFRKVKRSGFMFFIFDLLFVLKERLIFEMVRCMIIVLNVLFV